MRWSECHPSDQTSIKTLLQTICYHNIPESYTSRVLLPHVQNLLPDVRTLTCTRHKNHNITTRPMILHHPAPPEIYLLKPFKLFTKDHMVSLDKRFTDRPIAVKKKPRALKNRKGRPFPGYFVLYDADNTLDRFPVSATLTLTVLRGILEKAGNLQFIFLY